MSQSDATREPGETAPSPPAAGAPGETQPRALPPPQAPPASQPSSVPPAGPQVGGSAAAPPYGSGQGGTPVVIQPCGTQAPRPIVPACRSEMWKQLTNAINTVNARNTVMWAIFAIFAAANMILASAVFPAEKQNAPNYLHLCILSGIGAFVSLLWGLAQRRAVQSFDRDDRVIRILQHRHLLNLGELPCNEWEDASVEWIPPISTALPKTAYKIRFWIGWMPFILFGLWVLALVLFLLEWMKVIQIGL